MTGDLQRQAGRRLREFREAEGLTQEQLAERLNKNRTYIGSIERGERNMSMQVVEWLAGALGISTDRLLCSDDSHAGED